MHLQEGIFVPGPVPSKSVKKLSLTLYIYLFKSIVAGVKFLR